MLENVRKKEECNQIYGYNWDIQLLENSKEAIVQQGTNRAFRC